MKPAYVQLSFSFQINYNIAMEASGIFLFVFWVSGASRCVYQGPGREASVVFLF